MIESLIFWVVPFYGQIPLCSLLMMVEESI